MELEELSQSSAWNTFILVYRLDPQVWMFKQTPGDRSLGEGSMAETYHLGRHQCIDEF